MDFSELGHEPLPIYRSSYSNCLIQQSSEHTWNTAVRFSCLQPKLTEKKLDTIQHIAACIMFEVPRDTHAEPILIFLQLDHLSDRREQHLVKLLKSFVTGRCHPAMTLLFQQPHGALSIHQSRTALGNRRPSVVGAITSNQWSAFNSDTEES